MPSSSTFGKAFVVNVIAGHARKNGIASMLDIGPGDGTYSRLITAAGLHTQKTAIEAWGPYIKDYKLDTLYDKVICGDARYINYSMLGRFDVAVAGDVLEHMAFTEAKHLVGEVLKNTELFICSVPVCHAAQGDEYGNPFERHIEEDYTSAMIQGLDERCVFVHTASYIGIGVFANREALHGDLRELCLAAENDTVEVADFDYPALEEKLRLKYAVDI